MEHSFGLACKVELGRQSHPTFEKPSALVLLPSEMSLLNGITLSDVLILTHAGESWLKDIQGIPISTINNYCRFCFF